MGYISEGAGLTGRVQWTHPNFTGGARSLTASLEGQTGRGAIGTEAEQLLRVSLSLTQPYVFTPRLSFIAGPWAEYRNDLHDESGAIGIDATLVYRLAALSSLALGYRFSARNIQEYHFGDITAGDVDLLALLAARYPPLIDSLGDHENRSSVTLAASFNRVDDVSDPTRGWLIRPSAELTVSLGLEHGGVRKARPVDRPVSPPEQVDGRCRAVSRWVGCSRSARAYPAREATRSSPSFTCATSR